jgi:outer membrane protein insertion porin family
VREENHATPGSQGWTLARLLRRSSTPLAMRSRLLAALAAALIVAAWGLPPDAARAQTGSGSTGAVPSATQRPERVTINRISVEGVPKQSTRNFVRRISGLSKGQQITLPGGDAVGEAIRAIYRSGLFSDVSVARGEPAEQGGGVHLVIRVAPEPGLAGYSFRGVDDNTKDDLREEITLAQGRPVRPADIQRAEQAIRSFYSSEGYLLADVQTRRQRTSGDQVRLVFDVDTGQEVEVEDIRFTGNRVFDDGDLRGAMQETQEDRWWRFWTSAQFDREKYEADLDRVIDYYNREGYYDATIVDDTTYVEGEENLIAEVRVREGDQYHVRNVEWRGNTVYPDEVLTQALGFGEGDVYNSRQLQRNLRSNRAANDVTSLYTDRGYVRFNVEPTVQPARGDSLDLTFNITEGDVYEVGNVKITGNTKTKDYVIRRELHTVPGRTFSRSDIKDSIRRLQQLGYFSKESIRSGPSLSVDQENREVDMVWSVEEVSNDQLELSGTYGGYGLVLQTSFTFNNFSAQNLFDLSEWQPLPVGDGQKLSLSVRTAGLDYQNYRVSFTEPWFRGQPTPVGGSISYARITGNYLGGRRRRRFGNAGPENAGIFQRFGVRAFRRQRLDWPDDNFRISSTVNYNYYRNDDRIYGSLPGGVSQQLSFNQGISRNSLNNPLFPSRGSKVKFSLEVAPPLADIQFHKWRFTNGWNVPLSQDGKLSFHVGTDYGYIGSLTGEDVDFQAFELGGTAFDYSRQSFGTDPIFMRGYPARSLNPVNAQNEFAPGRILNKYTSEVRYLAVDTRQLRAAPYLFLDAANTWAGFDTYDPSSLYRSAGVGAKLYLPIVGMIEVNYGYNFDRFPSENVVNGQRVLEDQGWRFQISFGGKRGS